MVLTAPQHSQIAAAYERAAADETLPRQARSAFAKKASWFRMLAQIRAAKQAHQGNAFPQMDARHLAPITGLTISPTRSPGCAT
jgi:hypothetical protein